MVLLIPGDHGSINHGSLAVFTPAKCPFQPRAVKQCWLALPKIILCEK